MPNRLADQPSPYLRQHAENPVAWWPWCDEAFEEARRRDVPVLVSVGYATCHWCHVMAHESFEDPATADAMNREMVCIKVDREERPDVDALYMAVCQGLTGSGGWPLNVFVDHERRPFFAGTYFPREGRHGRPGFADLVQAVGAAWKDRRDELLDQAQRLLAHITAGTPGGGGSGGGGSDARGGGSEAWPDPAACAAQLKARFDAENGGFGGAPKFPSPHNLLFLLRHGYRSGDGDAVDMVLRTVHAMSAGGIHDHLGGGFHRYSTDPAWLLPHFEKMLYDQATVAMAATEAWVATGDPAARATACSTLEYVLRDLQDPAGGFHCGEDADSEGEEGRFYTWTLAEVREVLGDAAALFADAYDVREEGNHHDEATRRPTGRNVLHRVAGDHDLARRHGLAVEDVQRRLRSSREALLARRSRRVRPALDDKVLTDWNGLVIAALARAGAALDEPRYVDAACRAVDFLRSTMWRDGGLRHRYRDGVVDDRAFLDDHAYLLWGLVETYQAAFRPKDLEWAVDVARSLEADHLDASGAYRLASRTDLPGQRVEASDGALPSGNAVAAWSLHRLSMLTGDPEPDAWARRIVAAFAGEASAHPLAYVGLHIAAEAIGSPGAELLVAGTGEEARQMLDAARRCRDPDLVVLRQDAGLPRVASWTEAMDDEAPTAYLCRDHACQRPVHDAQALSRLLAS